MGREICACGWLAGCFFDLQNGRGTRSKLLRSGWGEGDAVYALPPERCTCVALYGMFGAVALQALSFAYRRCSVIVGLGAGRPGLGLKTRNCVWGGCAHAVFAVAACPCP